MYTEHIEYNVHVQVHLHVHVYNLYVRVCTCMWSDCIVCNVGVGANNSDGECGLVITQEEMDHHNQKEEGNAWTVLHGKVYNLEGLSKQVNTEFH